MTPGMAEVIELVGKDIETVTITLFCIFRKLEKRLSMLSRGMSGMK